MADKGGRDVGVSTKRMTAGKWRSATATIGRCSETESLTEEQTGTVASRIRRLREGSN